MAKEWKQGGPWRVDEELPWLTKDSVRFIEKHIKKSHKVLEFGSGGSTIFFARRASEVISFESGGHSIKEVGPEHALRWYTILTDKLRASNIKNVELYLLHSYPHLSAVHNRLLDALPDNYFNWVLVDGGCRRLCTVKGKDKLISGGYLIIDNYASKGQKVPAFLQYEYCLDYVKKALNNWKRLEFDQVGWGGKGTLILQKP